MSKSIKVLSIILIIFSLIISFYSVYASDIDMNLASSDNTETETQLSSVSDSITSPYSIGSIAEEGLTTSNIISILLITVGVILILLAIAIIIRLK